jgi:hypothetical protein
MNDNEGYYHLIVSCINTNSYTEVLLNKFTFLISFKLFMTNRHILTED